MISSVHCSEFCNFKNTSKLIFCITNKDNLDHTLNTLELSDSDKKLFNLKLQKEDQFSNTVLTNDEAINIHVFLLKNLTGKNATDLDVFALRKFLSKLETVSENTDILVSLGDLSHAHTECVAAEIARNTPAYNRKTDEKSLKAANINVFFENSPISTAILDTFIETLRDTIRRVDTPTLEFNTDIAIQEFSEDAKKFGLSTEVIRDDDRLGGLKNVGKAAVHKPALMLVRYEPKEAKKHVALVGKGLVYDTGGLSLKPRDGMVGMKTDMAGSAAVYGAIRQAAAENLPVKVTALLCLAENAIGSDALRPDDVITLFSGKTVEINNTDAEGRLVLGDGVAYASKRLNPDVIIDMATLTGAALIATGKHYAGILTPSDATEAQLIKAGKSSGEPVFPLLYDKDTLMKEFKSDIADMKNSCKDRYNAQSSCAGHFVEAHLDKDYKGEFAHIDIAGPADVDGKATGYGVNLLLTYLRNL